MLCQHRAASRAGKPPRHSGARDGGRGIFFFRFVGVGGCRFWGDFLVAFFVFFSFLLVRLFVWSWGGFVLVWFLRVIFFFGFGWVGFFLFLRRQRINLFPCKKEKLFERHAGERAAKPSPGRAGELPAGGGTCCRACGAAAPGCPCSCRSACDSRTPAEAPSTAGPLRREQHRVNPGGERPPLRWPRGSRGGLGQLRLCARPAGARGGSPRVSQRQE